MILYNEEFVLFKKWKEKRTKIVKDGIVDYLSYNNSRNKVLYILKEVNGGKKCNSNWDLRYFLKTGGRRQTWDMIALWNFGINNVSENLSWESLKNKIKETNFRKRQLESIAVINLKKEPGGHTANSNLVWDYSWQDKDLLKEQISLYKPTIIICCGTGEIVKKYHLVEKFKIWKESYFGIKYHITKHKSIIINYCHPEARVNDNYKYFPLIETLREIQTNNIQLNKKEL